MEVAVYTMEDGKIVDEFSTLVNPGKAPDAFVQKLTGITPKMLRKAPRFEQVAARLLRMLQGGVLVAHGAGFDYAMLRKEFSRLGYELDLPYLCTQELAREMFPDLPNYGLENLTKALRIPVKHRHRAFGDAYATAQIFKIIWQKDPSLQTIAKHIHNAGGLSINPYPTRITKLLDSTSGRQSVLKLFDKDDRLLYAGYAYHPRLHLENLLATHPDLMERLRHVETDPVPGRLIGRIEAQWLNRQFSPPFSSYKPVNFNGPLPWKNALLFDRGRFPYEQSVFLVEDGRLYGYGYVDLNWQAEDLRGLKQRMTRLDDCPTARKAVWQHARKERFDKIVDLDEKAPVD